MAWQRSTFVGLTYKSFCDVDRKLAELADLQTTVERAQANARRFALLVTGYVYVWRKGAFDWSGDRTR